MIWRDQPIGYAELLGSISAFAAQLPSGAPGKIAIFAENRPEWAYAFYAVVKRGHTLVPIDFMSSAEDVAYVLGDCHPELIFCSEQTRSVLEQAIAQSDADPQVLMLEQMATDATDHASEPVPMPPLDRTLLLIYTSGTTGSPRGVMLSCDNVLANIESVTEHAAIYRAGERVLVLLPMHHIFPLLGCLVAPLYVGGTCVFAPSMSSEDVLHTLGAHRVSIMIGVPRLYSLIAASIKTRIDASLPARALFALAARVGSRAFSRRLFAKVHQRFGGHIRYLVSGGAKLDEDVGRVLEVLGFEVLEGFGMTEAAPMITFTRPGEVLIGSPGRPMPCNEVRIVDGEILARGRNIMQGYYNRHEETAEVIRDGWLHTGDLGYLDKAGFLHITGRKKEIIVLPNGKNINPTEIEEKLAGLADGISEVAVFLHQDSLHAAMVPDMRRLRALEISDPAAHLKDQVLAAYNQAVTPYKKVMHLHLLSAELPKTRLGKLKRFMLPELVAQTETKKVRTPEPDTPEYLAIRQFIGEQKAGQDIHADAHLELDLALDSLDLVGLQTFLEGTFGIPVTEQTLADHPTVGALAEHVRAHKTRSELASVDWAEILAQPSQVELPRSGAAHNPLRHLMTLPLRGYFRLSGRGQHNLPARPCILAPNHQSFLDGLFVAAFLDNATVKRTYFFAKAKHVNKPWLRYLASSNNIIVLDLERDLKHALQNLAEVLRRGGNLIIFPEGTRSKDGTMAPFRKTYAILSRELGVPVVPVAIDGAWDALPRGSRMPKPGAKIQVSFLEPVEPGDQSYEALNETVMARVRAALD